MTVPTAPAAHATGVFKPDESEHEVLDALPNIIMYDDGNNHGDEYPDEWREWLQSGGRDITFTTNTGKVVNASWTFNEIRKEYLRVLEDPNTSPELRAALDTNFYRSVLVNPPALNPGNPLTFFNFTFREDNQTGDVSMVIYDPNVTSGWGGAQAFHPGDTIYRITQLSVNEGGNFRVSQARMTPTTITWGSAQDENGEWDFAASGEWLPYRDLRIDHEPSDLDTATEPFYRSSEDGPSVRRLMQTTTDIPKEHVYHVQLRNNYQTVGATNTAATINWRQNHFRVPKIVVHHVMDEDYRKANDRLTEDNTPDASTPLGLRTTDESDRRALRDHRYFPLADVALSETSALPDDLQLPENLEFSNLRNRTAYAANENRDFRIITTGFPEFYLAPTQAQWQEQLSAPVPGFIEMGHDLPVEGEANADPTQDTFANITFDHIVDPDEGSILLAQHYYRTFRLIPGVVELTKTDAETGEPLSGAQFQLYSADGETLLSDQVWTTDDEGKLSLYPTNGQDLREVLSDEQIRPLPYADDAGVISVAGDEPGVLLEPGSYRLKEIAAPEGYNLPENPWTEFEVTPRTTEELRYTPISVDVTNEQPEEEPTPTPTPTPEDEPTPTPTPEDEPTPTPEDEPTPTPEDEPTPTPGEKPETMADTGVTIRNLVFAGLGVLLLMLGAYLIRSHRLKAHR